MLDKIMARLGWEMSQPEQQKPHGKLDSYQPPSKKEVHQLTKENRINYRKGLKA